LQGVLLDGGNIGRVVIGTLSRATLGIEGAGLSDDSEGAIEIELADVSQSGAGFLYEGPLLRRPKSTCAQEGAEAKGNCPLVQGRARWPLV
jgi:hypothetical protein